MIESPFLNSTAIQWAWDSTSIGALKTCPRLYQYTILEGWQPRDESIHLRFGIEYHAALRAYDDSRVAGINHEDAVHDVVRETMYRIEDWDPDTDTRAGQFKNRHTLLRTIIDYLDHYENDAAKTYTLNNGKAAVEQSFRFELDWGPEAGAKSINPNYHQLYMLCGHLDKSVTYLDDLFVLDHKTTTQTLGDYYFQQYEPDNQMSLYTLAAKVVLDAPVKGVIIDAAQVAKDSSRFERRFTYRTPDQLGEWVNDLREWFYLAERYADKGYWPQNDKACGLYGGCKFREICSKSPDVRDRFLHANFTQLPPEERWNPLKTR